MPPSRAIPGENAAAGVAGVDGAAGVAGREDGSVPCDRVTEPFPARTTSVASGLPITPCTAFRWLTPVAAIGFVLAVASTVMLARFGEADHAAGHDDGHQELRRTSPAPSG